MKAIEQYIHIVLFVMLYKSVHQAIVCDHSIKVCLAVLLCSTVLMLNKVVPAFKSELKPQPCVTSQSKLLLSSTVLL